jgi:hypothetical protein
MFGSFGIPELIVLLVIGSFWLIPIAAAVWAGLTLYRIRTDQHSMGTRLEAIERLLHAGR